VRFVFLLGLVAAPIIVRNILDALEPVAEGRRRIPTLVGAHLAAGAGLVFTVLGAIHVVPLLDPRRAPGFGPHDAFVPEGAMRYLDREGITGRIYNPFHVGGYIEWRDFPRRSSIIDGRGYVPAGMLEEIHFARAYVEHLERLRATYGFDVAVVDYPAHTKLSLEEMSDTMDLGLIAPGWALVYWDDVALVYLRRTERLASLIARDEYTHVRPANGPAFLMRALERGDEPTRTAIVAELDRNIAQTRSSVGTTLRGYAALESGDLETSTREFSRVTDLKFLPQATLGLAVTHWRRGDVAGSLAAYRKRLRLGEDPRLLFSVGVALVRLGRPQEAIGYLERARRLGPDFAPVYPALLDAYRRAGVTHDEQDLAKGHADALARSRAEEHLARARTDQRDGRLTNAVAELEAALEIVPTSADIVSQLGYVYLFLGRLDEAIAQQLAALQIDPKLPKAHYGLALVYERLGDDPRARDHFRAYASLEPRTYQAWRIREGFPLPGQPASR
jgi:tetratricopeptide (TPR) repeat protein